MNLQIQFGSSLKYVGGTAMQGDKASRSAVNIKVIRLSEIYLLAAEAALSLPTPDKVKAATYLNQIRKRAPALTPANETTVTVDMIMDEKSKEFFAEGHRFFDMIRLNKTIEFNDEFISPAVIITHRAKTIDRTFYKTILPISQTEMDANPPIAASKSGLLGFKVNFRGRRIGMSALPCFTMIGHKPQSGFPGIQSVRLTSYVEVSAY